MGRTAAQQATEVRSKQVTAAVNAQQSLAVCKNLLRVAVAQVLWLRGIFDECNFKVNKMAGMEVKSLRKCSENQDDDNLSPEAHTIASWLEDGVFPTLEKRILRSVVFNVSDEETQRLMETYVFRVSYPDDDTVQCVIQVKVLDTTKGMVRALVTTLNSLPPLPKKKRLSMKLVTSIATQFYYDDRLEDPKWNPPHFIEGREDDMAFTEPPTKIPCGNVMTQHHKLNIKVAFAEAPEQTSGSDEEEIRCENEESGGDGRNTKKLEKEMQEFLIDEGIVSLVALQNKFDLPLQAVKSILRKLNEKGVLRKKKGMGERYEVVWKRHHGKSSTQPLNKWSPSTTTTTQPQHLHAKNPIVKSETCTSKASTRPHSEKNASPPRRQETPSKRKHFAEKLEEPFEALKRKRPEKHEQRVTSWDMESPPQETGRTSRKTDVHSTASVPRKIKPSPATRQSKTVGKKSLAARKPSDSSRRSTNRKPQGMKGIDRSKTFISRALMQARSYAELHRRRS